MNCGKRQFVGVAVDHNYFNARAENDEQDRIGANKMSELESYEVVTL